MASSVEGREPFLDHELVELAMALPPRMKYRDGQGKYVLREAMRDALPPEVLARPKQGFGSPMEEWLRGDFGRDAQAAVRGSELAERELLDYDVVDRLFAAHRRRPRRLEQAPVEPLLRQPAGTTGGWRSRRPRCPALLLDALPARDARRARGRWAATPFFADVEAQRYALEPDIPELVRFERWAGRDVLEAGCGIGDRRRALRARRRPLHGRRLQPDRARAGRAPAGAGGQPAASKARSPRCRSTTRASTSSTPTASSTTCRRPPWRSPSSTACCVRAALRSRWSTTATR